MATESTEEHGTTMSNLNCLPAIFPVVNNAGAAPAVPLVVIIRLEGC
jgi:hypothetical protein